MGEDVVSGPPQDADGRVVVVVLHDRAPVQAAHRRGRLGVGVAVAAVVDVVADAGHQQR